jgi:hypothetical protein
MSVARARLHDRALPLLNASRARGIKMMSSAKLAAFDVADMDRSKLRIVAQCSSQNLRNRRSCMKSRSLTSGASFF